MVAAAPSGGLGRCVAHSGGAWRPRVRRRLCRPAVADLSGRARLQRARGRHHCHRHAGRHRPDDSVGWLDRQPLFPTLAAFDRRRADGRDRRWLRDDGGILATPGHRRCRHDEPDIGRCEHFCTARTDRAHRNHRAAAANRAVRALQRHRLLRGGTWRACRCISRLRHGVDRVQPLNRDAADVWSLRLPRARRVPTVSVAFAGRRGCRSDTGGPAGAFEEARLWDGRAIRHGFVWHRLSGAVAAGALALSGPSGFGDDNSDDPVLDRGFSAVSYLVAVPIAERIGLINTMVFTHLPSNILLILTPLAPNLATAIALLLVRSALSQMDVPTRTSYVMAVVTPPERPAAASITAVPKTFAWAAGSMISGYLLTLSTFGWPLLIGGVIKGVYDILLLIKFQKVRPPEEAGAAAD